MKISEYNQTRTYMAYIYYELCVGLRVMYQLSSLLSLIFGLHEHTYAIVLFTYTANDV